MVAVPGADAYVTVPWVSASFNTTLATPEALDVALIVPLHVPVSTVNVVVVVGYVNVALVGVKVMLHVPRSTVTETVLLASL